MTMSPLPAGGVVPAMAYHCLVIAPHTLHRGQKDGVGAKIAYCRDDCPLYGKLQPNDVLVAVDGARVDRVFTAEVRHTTSVHQLLVSETGIPHAVFYRVSGVNL